MDLAYAWQLAMLVDGFICARWVFPDKWFEEFCLLGVAGDALLAALTRYQETGSVLWQITALLVCVAAAPWARNLQGKTGVMASRKERRAMAQLFGEQSFADMLFRDPRMKSFRRQREPQPHRSRTPRWPRHASASTNAGRARR